MAEKYFKYIPQENRYVLEEREGNTNPLPRHRIFEQAAVLHTSEDANIGLTRAYNLEDEIAINDAQLVKGAESRGQKLGEVSGDKHLKDDSPENDI